MPQAAGRASGPGHPIAKHHGPGHTWNCALAQMTFERLARRQASSGGHGGIAWGDTLFVVRHNGHDQRQAQQWTT